MSRIGNKPVVAIDTTVYDHPEAFGKVSHHEGNSAIVILDKIPSCKSCTQPLPDRRLVYR